MLDFVNSAFSFFNLQNDEDDFMSAEKHAEMQKELYSIRDHRGNRGAYALDLVFVNRVSTAIILKDYSSANEIVRTSLSKNSNAYLLSDLFCSIFYDAFCNKEKTKTIQLNLAKTLLEAGACINYATVYRDNLTTPLQLATALGDVEAATFLFEFGAKKIKGKKPLGKYEKSSEKTYRLAKEAFITTRYKKYLFIFAFTQNGSKLGSLPKELVAKIVCIFPFSPTPLC